jgi:hypothetical protein
MMWAVRGFLESRHQTTLPLSFGHRAICLKADLVNPDACMNGFTISWY